MPISLFLILLNLLFCFVRRTLPVAATLASYVEIDAITMALSTYVFILTACGSLLVRIKPRQSRRGMDITDFSK